MGFIYMLTSPSGKSYIGQTIRPIHKRFYDHQRPKSECSYVSRAIKKYGWENIEKEWYYCPDEDLDKHEEMLIEVLNTITPFGYNLKTGGANGKPSDETKIKQSIAQSGENNGMHGRNHSRQSKTKMSEAKKGTQAGENNPRYGVSGEQHPTSRRVYQFDSNGAFINSHGSVREAVRSLNKTGKGSGITSCANGKKYRKMAYGFQWSYNNISPGIVTDARKTTA